MAHIYPQCDLAGYHNVAIFFLGHLVFEFAFYTLHIINEISRRESAFPYPSDLKRIFR